MPRDQQSMNTEAEQARHAIAVLNDNFRVTFIGGRVLLTHGVSELPIDVKAQALLAVQSFSGFDEANDPHREHDFGSFEIDDRKLFWKIDYYAATMEFGSEDPADPSKTTRVLTIMLASEY
jgi:hypothetical protein